MKRIAVLLLFPYLVPFLVLGVIGFVYVQITPSGPEGGTGPAASGMLGAFFLFACAVFGGLGQVCIGIPLSLLLMKVRSRLWRNVLAVEMGLMPFGLFCLTVREFPLVNELMVSALLVAGLSGGGAWLSQRFMRPPAELPDPVS